MGQLPTPLFPCSETWLLRLLHPLPHLQFFSSLAVAVSYAKQVVKMMDSVLMAGQTTVERNKVLNTQKMGASLFTTLLFHGYDPVLPSYVTLTAQTSLMAFIKARQC